MINKDKVRELAIKLIREDAFDYANLITEWLEQNQPEPVVVGLTDEQVWDLANELEGEVDSRDNYEIVVKNYLKTQTFTQPEIKVVGLSDEQIYNLYNYLANAEHGFVAAYKEWAKPQTFTQPEVREITVGLSDADIDSLTTHLDCFVEGLAKKEDIKFAIEDWLKTQTFTQPEVKEVVVGLSDEKIMEFCRVKGYNDLLRFEMLDWLKTQTFAEPCECGLNISQIQKDQFNNLQTAYEIIANQKEELEQLKSEYSHLQTCYNEQEALLEKAEWLKKETEYKLEQLKSQQSTPSWEDIPEIYNKVTVDILYWINASSSNHEKSETLVFERPKPTPEVGQVWKYQDSKYQIDSIGKVKMDEWGDCVTYRSLVNGKFYTRTLSDFLEKFESVS